MKSLPDISLYYLLCRLTFEANEPTGTIVPIELPRATGERKWEQPDSLDF